MTKFLNISTDSTLGGTSADDALVASQKATKEYVDDKTEITYDSTNERLVVKQ